MWLDQFLKLLGASLCFFRYLEVALGTELFKFSIDSFFVLRVKHKHLSW